MKRLKQLLLAALVAGAAQLASALTYNASDLLLVFRQGGANDVEFNLGAVGNFLNQPAGTPIAVSYDTNTVYTNFANSFAGVKFAAVAATTSSATQPRVWLTDANLVSTPTDFTVSKFSVVRGKVDAAGVQNGAITGTTNVPLVISPTAVGSYSYIVSPGNVSAIGTFGGDVPFTVEANNGSSLAFYQVVASAVTPKPAAIKVGTFDFANNGSVTFTPVAVTPVFTSAALSAQAATLNAGVSKTFSVTADGQCGFQWYLGGVAISGATNSTYTIASPTAANAGAYTVVASNCVYGTTTTSVAAQLNVISAPSIATQPVTQTVARGGSATFSVVANNGYAGTGTPPTLAYQWYLDGAALFGATGTNLTVSPVNFTNLGNYSVSVSNPAGSVTSSNAKLSFTAATAYLPGDLQLIFRQTGFSEVEFNLGTVSNYLNLATGTVIPVNFNTNAVFTNFGSSLTSVKFAVAAANSSKAWLSDANLITVPNDVTLSKFSALRGKVDNAGVQAAAITAGVNPLVISPTAVSAWDAIVSPGNASAVGTLGGDSAFTVEALNGNSLALYQILPSATTPKPLAQKIGTFNYAANGSVTFTASAITPVILTATLPAQTIAAGANSSTLAVTASEASTYQWLLNGSTIAGATGSSFTVTGATLAAAGSYAVVVSNAVYGTTVTSGSAAVTVIGAPSIVSGPDNVTVNNGMDATFTVSATNTFAGTGANPALTYQWTFNGTAISGATATSYTVTSAQVVNAGTYAVIVSNLAGSVSNSATLTVIDPYISVQPASVGVLATSNATFSVTAISGFPLSYQWRVNGTNLVNATNATLVVSNCPVTFNGRVYSVVVSNANGVVTSSNATLSVGATVTITTPPASLVKNQGQVAIFTVKASGLTPFTYQWLFNGAPIGGATAIGYTNFSVNTNNAGNYSVIVGNAIGSITSAVATLTVNLDTNKPIVAITSPAASATLFVAATSLLGTAADMNGRVAQVLVNFNSAGYVPATLNLTNTVPDKASWSFPMNFAVGTNTVVVKAVDFAGNETAAPVSRMFFYAVPSALTVNIVGSGSVASTNLVASLGGSNIFVGKSYTLIATPANTNWLFSNWVNTATSAISSSNKYTFVMSTNLTLTVNFVTNRFIAAAGNYYGLFSETNGAAEQSAGYFTVKTDSKQVFSGTVFVDGESTAIAGKFNLAGVGTPSKPVLRRGKPTLTVALLLNFDDTISGTVSCADEGWTSPLLGDRAVFSPLANPATNIFAPKYTLLIPGSTNGATEPAGYGYASVTIGLDGLVKATVGAAMLADGQKFAPRKASVSKNGYWPVYSPQYLIGFNTGSNTITSYAGTVIGWLQFNTNSYTNATISGSLEWIKTGWTNVIYSIGFTNSSSVLGSAYTPPATGQRGIFITNGVATFSDGNLASPQVINVTITNNNMFKFNTNNLGISKAAFSASSGVVSGSFSNATTGVVTKFGSVYLPVQNIIGGSFSGTNQSGSLLIQ